MPITPDPDDPALSTMDAIAASIVKILRDWPPLQAGQGLIAVRDLLSTVDVDFSGDFPPRPTGKDVQLFVIQSGTGGMTKELAAGDPAGAGVIVTQRYSLLCAGGQIAPQPANKVNEAALEAMLAAGHTLNLGARGVIGWQMTWVDMLGDGPQAPQQEAPDHPVHQRLSDVVVRFRKGGVNARPSR